VRSERLISGFLLIAVAFVAVVPGASAGDPESELISFEIKDQFDRAHSEKEFLGRPLLITCGDKNGSRYQSQWTPALRDSLQARGLLPELALVEIADLRGVPFFVKGKVKKNFPRDPSAWVLLDWDGRFAKPYAFEKEMCNILLFAPGGALVYATAVESVSQDEIVRILDYTAAAVEESNSEHLQR